MRLSGLMILLAAAILAASILLPRYAPGWMGVDVFAFLLVFLAIRAPTEETLPLCWFTGLVRDLLSGGPLGGYALLYLLAGVVLLRVRAATDTRMFLTRAALVFSVALVTDAVWLAKSQGVLAFWRVAGLSLRMALMTGAMAPVVLWLLDRFAKRLGIRRGYVFGTT